MKFLAIIGALLVQAALSTEVVAETSATTGA